MLRIVGNIVQPFYVIVYFIICITVKIQLVQFFMFHLAAHLVFISK